MSNPKNHLAKETSPYLQQHANNPVDWYAWNEESLALAKKLNKPILLSIGYSACHWCHVMAHESFEDEATAALMNELFINIKVDREERPDLDHIYQLSLQLLTGKAGGWPLTMFLTPDKQIPFFGGTYFAKRAGFGQPTFKDVLQQIANYYQQHHENVKDLTEELQGHLHKIYQLEKSAAENINSKPMGEAFQYVSSIYDNENTGFGRAQKFPQPDLINFLLFYWHFHNDDSALVMAINTLSTMARSGLNDHIGDGFFRYCVDIHWEIPHFEKMLYDNALLLPCYVRAFLITQNPLFKKTALNTAKWVMREMQAEEGGYYSTLNADTEGEEGKFYLWQRDEIQKLVTEDEFEQLKSYFSIEKPPNFGDFWHLQIADSNKNAAETDIIKSAKNKLFKARENRIKPFRDEKIIAAWNGLMIKGMAITAKHLKTTEILESAERAINFIMNNLWQNNRLKSSFKDGQAKLPAYLMDYAFLLEGILHFLECKWNSAYFNFAIKLAERICQDFYDKNLGGFYCTAHDHETLMHRPISLYDDAMPSPNGVAILNLLKLGHLLGREDFLEPAQQCLQRAWSTIEKSPTASMSLLMASEEYLNPSIQIIIRGEKNEIAQWRDFFATLYLPKHQCFTIENSIQDIPEPLQKPTHETVVAYFCQGKICFDTIDSFENFKATLSQI